MASDIAKEFPQEWYDLTTETHFWMQWRFRIMKHAIKRVEIPMANPLKVMDVGSGVGIVRNQIEKCTQWAVDCVEMEDATLSRIGQGRGALLNYNIFERAPERQNAYDIVVCFDVLEHIREAKKFANALIDHVKPGGYLFINVPALPVFYSDYDRLAGHVTRYTKKTLTAEFDSQRVEKCHMHYWGASLLPILFARCLLYGLKRSHSMSVREGFEPPHPFIDLILRSSMYLETQLLPTPPLGTSLMLVLRRRK